MRLVWDAIGRVDPNMILLIVRVIRTRCKMGVYQIKEKYLIIGPLPVIGWSHVGYYAIAV